MDNRVIKLSGWWYGLAALVLVLGCLGGMTMLYLATNGLPSALAAAYDLDRLTQVVVPGSADLTLSRTGAYAVYYEYQSVVDGVAYVTSETPPPLVCSLTAQATGREIPVVLDFVATNRYYADWGRRQGILVMSTTIDEPGDYTFSARYPDGRESPQIVLAVGQNIFWEVGGVAVSVAGSVLSGVLGGLIVLCGSVLAAVAIAIVVAVKRQCSCEPTS
jgi:hypothetical protein